MKKSLIVLCVLAMCSVVWAEDKKVAVQDPQKEKPDLRSVIVDAWLVRVDADALAESGVKPLSEKDKENVSVMNLLWCLNEPNSGEVIISSQTRSGLNNEATTSFNNTIYISRSNEIARDGRGAITNSSFNQRIDFRNYSNIVENKQIGISWEFNSNFVYNKNQNDYPPDSGSVSFKNHWTIMPAGKPVIVGQTQIGKDMFFLVMKAEIVE
jgi:hypothetical protein